MRRWTKQSRHLDFESANDAPQLILYCSLKAFADTTILVDAVRKSADDTQKRLDRFVQEQVSIHYGACSEPLTVHLGGGAIHNARESRKTREECFGSRFQGDFRGV